MTREGAEAGSVVHPTWKIGQACQAALLEPRSSQRSTGFKSQIFRLTHLVRCVILDLAGDLILVHRITCWAYIA